MISSSVAVMGKWYTKYAVLGLASVILVAQGAGYGFMFQINFLLRNIGIVFGLLAILSESSIDKKDPFIGLILVSQKL